MAAYQRAGFSASGLTSEYILREMYRADGYIEYKKKSELEHINSVIAAQNARDTDAPVDMIEVNGVWMTREDRHRHGKA